MAKSASYEAYYFLSHLPISIYLCILSTYIHLITLLSTLTDCVLLVGWKTVSTLTKRNRNVVYFNLVVFRKEKGRCEIPNSVTGIPKICTQLVPESRPNFCYCHFPTSGKYFRQFIGYVLTTRLELMNIQHKKLQKHAARKLEPHYVSKLHTYAVVGWQDVLQNSLLS